MSEHNPTSSAALPSSVRQGADPECPSAEEAWRRDRSMLEAIHRAQTEFILAGDSNEVFASLLDSLLSLTNSEYGFIDEMFSTAEGQPYLTARAITDISWNDESRKMYQQFVDGTLSFTNLKSLYGEVMKTGQPLIANDAAQDPRRAGTPPGHPPLKSFLGLPLLSHANEFVGMIGLANRPGGFSEELIRYVAPMLTTCANLIAARKNDLRRRQVEEELWRAQDELKGRTLAQDAENARLRAEQVEERLNLALKSSGVGTWSWDVAANSIVWDDFIHPLFGLAPGTFPGRYEDFLRMLHADDRDRVTLEVAHAVEEDAPYDTEYQVVWPDGSVHVLGSRGKVYRDPGGRALRMTGVCWDLTDRKRLDDRFRAAVEAAPAAMVMINAASEIVLINQQTEQLFGYHRTELLGKSVDLLVPERFRPGHPVLRDGFFANPRPLKIGQIRVLAGQRKDGSEFPLELGLNPIHTDEGLLVLAAVVDITERKRTEEEIFRQASELVRSNKELEHFAFVASHDLQEPLRKIRAFGDMLAARVGESLNEEGRDYLQRMQNAARRMQDLINDLLGFARVTSHAQCFVTVDLSQVVREVVSDLETRIRMTGGQVEVGDLPSIDADRTQMRQLYQNLISNALKFHRPGVAPVVSVQARLVRVVDGVVQRDGAPNLCETTVRDNGIGFEEKHSDRIFTPFQRLHSRGEYEGTGMGLTICRKIVARHGGTITAHSKPGQGSAFVVTLPIQQREGLSNA